MARTRDEAAFAAKQQEILKAAEALFIQHGFHQTGMAAICKAVGMSPGALYRYFPAKTDIIRAIVEHDEITKAKLFEALENAKNFKGAIVTMLVEAITVVRHPDYGPLALEIAAEGNRNPEVAAILTASEQEDTRRLTQIIQRARRRGLVDASVDPAATARLLIMVVDGATSTRWGSPLPTKPKLRQTLIRLVGGLFPEP